MEWAFHRVPPFQYRHGRFGDTSLHSLHSDPPFTRRCEVSLLLLHRLVRFLFCSLAFDSASCRIKSDWSDTTNASIAKDNGSEVDVSILNRLFFRYVLRIGWMSRSCTLLFNDSINESTPEADDSRGDSSIIGQRFVRQWAVVKYKSMVRVQMRRCYFELQMIKCWIDGKTARTRDAILWVSAIQSPKHWEFQRAKKTFANLNRDMTIINGISSLWFKCKTSDFNYKWAVAIKLCCMHFKLPGR